MKKKFLSILASLLIVASLAGCGSSESKPAEADTKGDASQTEQTESFAPKGNIDFLVSSKAGGGSDIFTRSITDIASKQGIVSNPFVVNNLQDGNGQIARRNVKDAKGGAQIVVGGTSSDERNVYDMLVQALGLEDNFSYIVYGSSSETMTALLGGHVDLGMSKPAASKEYVLSGDISPVLALSSERFSAPFDTAPTADELGYGVIELPVWRGVIGSANMSDEAVTYWNNVFKQVTETDEWKANYLEKNLLVNNYMNVEDTTSTMLAAEKAIVEAAG